MGLSLSTEADTDDTMREVVGKEYGFRVHHVEPNSPGHLAGLTSILDYIVVANGVRLDKDDGSFVNMIHECKDSELRICVFNTHTLRTRETTLIPNDNWGGSGLLGVTIRFDIAQPVEKHTLRVLDVYPASPASSAGLDAFNDYILCVGDRLFDGPDEFGEIVQYNCNRPVRLFVYNARSEEVRELTIMPDRSWGGEGCLGCGVGAGYLHSLPRKRILQTKLPLPSTQPKETSAGPDGEEQVPADNPGGGEFSPLAVGHAAAGNGAQHFAEATGGVPGSAHSAIALTAREQEPLPEVPEGTFS